MRVSNRKQDEGSKRNREEEWDLEGDDLPIYGSIYQSRYSLSSSSRLPRTSEHTYAGDSALSRTEPNSFFTSTFFLKPTHLDIWLSQFPHSLYGNLTVKLCTCPSRPIMSSAPATLKGPVCYLKKGLSILVLQRAKIFKKLTRPCTF